jgi:hypothetical protein
VRNGVVILTGKKGSGRNHGAISRVKKEKMSIRVAARVLSVCSVTPVTRRCHKNVNEPSVKILGYIQ